MSVHEGKIIRAFEGCGHNDRSGAEMRGSAADACGGRGVLNVLCANQAIRKRTGWADDGANEQTDGARPVRAQCHIFDCGTTRPLADAACTS